MPIRRGNRFAARDEALGEIKADAANRLDQVAAQSVGMTQGVLRHGDQGKYVALYIQIAVKKNAAQRGFPGIADHSIQFFSGAECGDEFRRPHRRGGPGPSVCRAH